MKIAQARNGAPRELHLLPADDIEGARDALRDCDPARVGITGGGSPLLADLIDARALRVTEFGAWARGATTLLRAQGIDTEEPFVVVSVGTGCSAMRVDGKEVTRLGGTALGGGTLLGLGAALLGTRDFAEILALANHGDRRNVDLLVGDIAGGDAIELPNQLPAASFAQLASGRTRETAEAADLASAILGLVGENVGWICAGLARVAGVGRIAFGGSTLRNNATVSGLLRGVAMASGLDPVVLEDGEFTGAIGALELALEA